LLKEFPDSRYLLTIRDCYSWMNSLAKHRLRYRETGNPVWDQLRKYRAGKFPHTPQDQALKEKGLGSMDFYMNRWATHNQAVLDKVPAHRLLIVKTNDIRKRALEIASFAGLPTGLVRVEHTHAFQNPANENIIQRLDPSYVEEKVEQYCRPLMQKFFPEIKSLQDVKL
jgi:hypothetical protein